MLKIFGWLFLIGWVAGQIFRLPGWLPVTMLDVAVGVVAISELAKICLFAVTPRITRGKPARFRSGWPRAAASLLRKFANFANKQKGVLYITIIFTASWALGLRLFSWEQSIPGGLYLFRFLGYLWVIVNAEKLLAPVKKFIIPAFWIFVILAWAQYLLLPDIRFLLKFGWDEHYYRMIGTVLDPNYLGVMLGIMGIYLIYKYANRQIDKWEKILLALSFGGLALTYSRASWVATVVVSCWLLVVSRGHRNKLGKLGILGILGIIGIMGIWLAAPKPGGEGINLLRTSSIEQRVESWREGINVWREHPWLGVGFNNYGGKVQESTIKYKNVQEGKNHSENAPSSSWILLLATVGTIGIGGLGVIGGIRGIGEMKKNKLWMGILMMVGVHAIFNNTIFYPPILGLLALIKAASEE
ncbi:O-antigen ligase family protein [Candidatus Collierbacteria bacterium]|nr:O-antigen ligase family protein [Candidatus Collierbacteria bacterium]